MERLFELDGTPLKAVYDYHDGEPGNRDNPGCPPWIELNEVRAQFYGVWVPLSFEQRCEMFIEYGGGDLARGKAEFNHDCIKHAQEVYTNGQH